MENNEPIVVGLTPGLVNGLMVGTSTGNPAPGLSRTDRFMAVPLLIDKAHANRLSVVPQMRPVTQSRARKPEEMYSVRDGVALISLTGPLVNESGEHLRYYGYGSYPEFMESVNGAVTDSSVQSILLVIDSPGGETSGAFEAADTVKSAAKVKPVYAVAADNMFSAAYLIGSQAKKVYVNRMSGVGSIGVVAMHADVSGMLEQMGVKVTFVFAGKHKVDGNPYQALSESAKTSLQSEVDRRYDMFVDYVAEGRGMRTQAVRNTEAALFFGDAGIKSGLADAEATPQEALAKIISEQGVTNTGLNRISHQTVSTPQPAGGQEGVQPMSETTNGATVPPSSQTDASYASAVEVSTLCQLAGKPEMATKFLTDRTPVADVRKQLLDLRASETDANGIHSHTFGHTGTTVDKSAELLATVMDQRVTKLKEEQNYGRR